MKRVLCLIWALIWMLALSSPVFATSVGTGSNSADVTADFQSSGAAAVNYKVEITWGSMEFTYHAGTTTRDWNPVTHKYEETVTEEPSWNFEEGSNKVTVTNASNQALTVQVRASVNAGYNAVTAQVTNGSFDLESAALNATTEVNSGTATSGTATVTLSGKLPADEQTRAGFAPIGTITVSIDDKA